MDTSFAEAPSVPSPESSGQKHNGRWQPGQSGNKAGKPRGTRNLALVALDAIGTEAAEDVLRTVVAAAKGGDLRAAEILLRRIWPERKGRPVNIALPPMRCAADLASVLGAVAEAVGAGELSPEEGQAIASMLETQRKAFDT